MLEIVTLVSNLGALTVIGLIYFAYIKNLKSVNELKNSQLKVAEQNIKLWKDRALEAERRTPEFIEKQLSDRIKIREEELVKLASDNKDHTEEIKLKNKQLETLRSTVESAQDFMSFISVYDSDEKDFVDIPSSSLETNYVGAVCVDTASLMICDPWYVSMDDAREEEELKANKNMFEVVGTKERFCSSSLEDSWPSEAFSIDDDHKTVKELLEEGLIKEIEYQGKLPAIKESYIKGDFRGDSEPYVYLPIRHQTFKNGNPGAGVTVGLGGDGIYYVHTESYKGAIHRIVIDV